MFEKYSDKIIKPIAFYLRVFRSFLATLAIVGFSLLFGSLGYCYFGHLNWDDGLLNAAMILTGMGPVDRMTTTPGKLFAAAYALYSGVAFLSMVAILIAPILHRFLHRFHLEMDQVSEDTDKAKTGVS